MTNADPRTLPVSRHHPLKLALVTQGDSVPAWVARTVRSIDQSGVATIVGRLRLHAPRRPSEALRSFLFRGYTRLDRRVFVPGSEVFGVVPAASVLPSVPSVDVRVAATDGQTVVVDPTTVAGWGLDLVLDLCPFPRADDFAAFARRGVWTLQWGNEDRRTRAVPGFWEVEAGSPTTHLALHAHVAESPPRVVDVSTIRTDPRSVARGQNEMFAKLPAFVLGNLHRFATDRQRPARESSPAGETARSRTPGNFAVVRMVGTLSARYVRELAERRFYRDQWTLAYQFEGLPVNPARLRYTVPPADRYWADPFPLRRGDDYSVFFEDARHSDGKGRISVLRIDERGNYSTPTVVLDEPFHLSYPFVFEQRGELFMVPECMGSRAIRLYRCLRFPESWQFEHELLSIPGADATLAHIDEAWWMFTNVAATGARNSDELHAFHAASPFGPWRPHAGNPLTSDVRNSRCAGRIFQKDGAWYRPAQDGSGRYGYAVWLNRIVKLSPAEYEEIPVARIDPTWAPHILAVHTYNTAGRLRMIDCTVRRPACAFRRS